MVSTTIGVNIVVIVVSSQKLMFLLATVSCIFGYATIRF